MRLFKSLTSVKYQNDRMRKFFEDFMKLFDKNSRFHIANIVTFLNITFGVVAIYFIIRDEFLVAIVLAWFAGVCDIVDGKLARRYHLTSEFGVQLDSFADFVSFVMMPSFLLFYALQNKMSSLFQEALAGAVFILYIILGLRRLIEFNLKSNIDQVATHFEGVPTPMGAILLLSLYMLFSQGVITNIYLILGFVSLIAWSLNSKLKIPHL